MGVGRSMVRLSDVDTRILSGLEYKLVCYFKLAADLIGVALESLCIMPTDQHSRR